MLLAVITISACCALCALAQPNFDQSAWPDDGFPLTADRDAGALDAIWRALENDADESRVFADAVDFQLRAQPKAYKGKTLALEGRLLRAVRENDDDPQAFYDLWILLDDSKRNPVRLLAKRAPEGFHTDPKLENDAQYPKNVQYRQERVRARAVFYRTTAYYAGDDFFAAPTLVAKSFQILPERARQKSAPANGFGMTKVAALLAVLAIWLALRARRSNARKERKRPETKLILLAALALANAPASALSNDGDDAANFWSILAQTSPDEWARETNEIRPRVDDPTPDAAKRRARAFAILARMNGLLGANALKTRMAPEDARLTLGERVANRAARPIPENADVFYALGRILNLESIEINEAEKERLGAENFARALVKLDDGQIVALYAPAIPSFRAPAPFFDKTPRPNAENAPKGERVGCIAVKFGRERLDSDRAQDAPALLAPRIEWFPDDAPLARAGLDLAAFDRAPVYPVDALAKEKDPERRKAIARAMRWSENDRRPFYGALAAVKRDSSHPVAFDPKTAQRDLIELFNHPERCRGRRFAIKGWARRVNLVVVNDEDAVAETGVERYYQILIFTNESQGRPLVLCVNDLPDGLNVGGGEKFRRNLEFSGVFYKTWAFQSSEKRVPTPDHDPKNDDPKNDDALETLARENDLKKGKWTCSPVLVGTIARVEPIQKDEPRSPVPPSAVFATFAILACAWIILRRIAAARNVNKIERRRNNSR